MGDWIRNDVASKRALDNARDAERAALNLLVDIQAGAFAGADTLEPVERAIRSLAEAYSIGQERWKTFLDSQHEDKAA